MSAPIATFRALDRLILFFLTGVTACKVLVPQAQASRSMLNRIISSRECFRGKAAPLLFSGLFDETNSNIVQDLTFLGQEAVHPPSIGRTAPFMNPASSEAT